MMLTPVCEELCKFKTFVNLNGRCQCERWQAFKAMMGLPVLFLIWFPLNLALIIIKLLIIFSLDWLTGPQLRGVNKGYNEKVQAAWEDIMSS